MQKCEYQEVGVLGAILGGCLPQLVQESQIVRILASSSLIYVLPFYYPSHDSDSEILLDQYIFPMSPFFYASIFLFCPERLRYSEKPMSVGIPKVRPNSNPTTCILRKLQNKTTQNNKTCFVLIIIIITIIIIMFSFLLFNPQFLKQLRDLQGTAV